MYRDESEQCMHHHECAVVAYVNPSIFECASISDRMKMNYKGEPPMQAQSGLKRALPVLLTSVLLALTAAAQKVEPTEENIAKGEAIYKKNCEMCHGATGLGDGPAGKRLNPKPANFQDKEKMAALTDEHLFKHIAKGDGPMPAFERKLKENERWMVLYYVRKFAK